jgi:hypothetical protein
MEDLSTQAQEDFSNFLIMIEDYIMDSVMDGDPAIEDEHIWDIIAKEVSASEYDKKEIFNAFFESMECNEYITLRQLKKLATLCEVKIIEINV